MSYESFSYSSGNRNRDRALDEMHHPDATGEKDLVKARLFGQAMAADREIKLLSWIVAVVANFGTSKIWLNSCESL